MPITSRASYIELGTGQTEPTPAPQTEARGFWNDADLISVYTRAQAIEDGTLVDVSEMAREAGFKWPVALTAGAWGYVEDIPKSKRGIEDVEGRLWDVLWMASNAVRRSSGVETRFRLVLRRGRKKYTTFKLVSGPGDHGEPVITIMLPWED
jgi:hypothetical protein